MKYPGSKARGLLQRQHLVGEDGLLAEGIYLEDRAELPLRVLQQA
jgi:hypothetical protein